MFGASNGKVRSKHLATRIHMHAPRHLWKHANSANFLTRWFLYVLFVGLIVIINESWAPPFSYQKGWVPPRSITSRVEFSAVDTEATEAAKRRARRNTCYIYDLNNKPLERMTEELSSAMESVLSATDHHKVPSMIWDQFFPLSKDGEHISDAQLRRGFESFKTLYKDDANLASFTQKLKQTLSLYHRQGILFKFETDERLGETRNGYIVVRTLSEEGKPVSSSWTLLNDVVIQDWEAFGNRLRQNFGTGEATDMLFCWLRLNLPSTLELNVEATEKEMTSEMDKVEAVVTNFNRRDRIVSAGKPLTASDCRFLYLEHASWCDSQPIRDQIMRFFAMWGMMCIVFFPQLHFASQIRQKSLTTLQGLTTFCFITLLTIGLAHYLFRLGCNAESSILMVYALTLGVAYGRKTTMLLLSCVIIATVLGTGGGFYQFLFLSGAIYTAVMPLDRIRSRKKLITLASGAAIVGFALVLALGILDGQPLSYWLLYKAGISALCVLSGGFLMHGLLPFEERLFGVVTDTQLLELSDVAHPLLQELIQRAPNTYSHSMLVASIAEAAAEAIGAHQLLARVGAYYHDIGKMVRPEYFVENQRTLDQSQHTSLSPSMSALVIINHVKDGIELAKNKKLPQQIIDFIQQHHGTTVVKYFLYKAQEEMRRKREESESQSNDSNPDSSKSVGKESESTKEDKPGGCKEIQLTETQSGRIARIDRHEHDLDGFEASPYQYPGPKPQTREIAIVMLADCVESACRTLVEPTPKRIEDLVNIITADKLQDGQFDECGLTFNELRAIKESMVMSLSSMYHARIKYPKENQ